jgi:hypothetical protein
MTTTAAHNSHDTTPERVLFVAFELTLPAGECAELLVSRALGWRWQAFEAHRDCGGGAYVAHCALAIPGDGGLTRGGSTQRGVNSMSVLNQASTLVLVEAARCISGPAKQAVVERGAPPIGLPALVKRLREHRVMGVCTRTERRALETRGPNATERRQTD